IPANPTCCESCWRIPFLTSLIETLLRGRVRSNDVRRERPLLHDILFLGTTPFRHRTVLGASRWSARVAARYIAIGRMPEGASPASMQPSHQSRTNEVLPCG